MIKLEQLYEKLKKDNIKIRDEIDEGINILFIDKIPATAEIDKSNRRIIYQYKPFIMKSCDKQKFGNQMNPYEELKAEFLAAKAFKDKVCILQKIAIIIVESLKESNTFLVEEYLKPFNKFTPNLIIRAIEEENQTKKIFSNGDFKKENLVYDNNSDWLLFTDVFPQTKHLINN